MKSHLPGQVKSLKVETPVIIDILNILVILVILVILASLKAGRGLQLGGLTNYVMIRLFCNSKMTKKTKKHPHGILRGNGPEFAEEIGVNYESARNLAVIAKKYELSFRNDNLTFTHHVAVAANKNKKELRDWAKKDLIVNTTLGFIGATLNKGLCL